MYEDLLSLRQARDLYFERWGLDAGGYTSKWVTLAKVGPLRLGFPNTPARIRAVKMHDLHHVATEYNADWVGEAEIGAWEIGASCHLHHAAWILNLMALLYGVFLSPSRVLAAFARGRKSETLYRSRELDEKLLDETVGELRTSLVLDTTPSKPGALDALLLGVWWLVGLALVGFPVAAFATLI